MPAAAVLHQPLADDAGLVSRVSVRSERLSCCVLMGDIAIKQLKMNSADEFRAARRGDIPRRYLDPDAPRDGQTLGG